MTVTQKVVMEAFHTGHAGSDLASIIAYTALGPLLVCVLRCYRRYRPALSAFQAHVQEFVCIVIPLLLCLTTTSKYTNQIALVLLAIVLLIITFDTRCSDRARNFTDKNDAHCVEDAIGIFKGINILVTCLAILAVDFRIFPRQFSKTEIFGHSLMDVGTGLFVTSSALTSRFVRKSNAQSLIERLKRCYIVFFLGIGRVFVVKALNYHEHASEYGLHWNFFLSLAAVWILADGVHSAVRLPSKGAFVGILLAFAHQCVLLWGNATTFVFDSPRNGFFAANREGLLSVSGYLSMYLIVEGVAWVCLEPLKGVRIVRLIAATCISWLVWAICSNYVQETSRRLSNAAYGALTVSVTCLLLCAYYVVCSFHRLRKDTVLLLRAMRKHSLPIFLVSNVLTGTVNMACHTVDSGPREALSILVGYSAFLCALVFALFSDSLPNEMAD